MRILILGLCVLVIGGCCKYKYIDNNKYSGTIRIPADHENKNGIISFQVDNENRKAILYVHQSNNEFKPGDIVHFKVAKIKDVVVARELEKKNSHISRDLHNHNLIELHNGLLHPTNTVHTIRHIIKRGWKYERVEGDNNKTYNIGEFKLKENPENSPDSIILYAVTPDITIDQLWQNDEGINLYFNINGEVQINGIKYPIVNKVAIRHSDLPHQGL